jgi:hypothetical protein
MVSSLYFQRRQGYYGKQPSQDPKSDYHLGFSPAGFLEVVMQGRHFKHPLLPQFKYHYLDDYRRHFQNKNTSNNQYQYFFFND